MKATVDMLDNKKQEAKLSKMLENAAMTKKLHKDQLQDQIR